MPTENCPACGLPGRLNLKHDDKKVLDIVRTERPLLEYDHDWVHQNITTLDGHLLSLRQSLSRLEDLTSLIKTQIYAATTAKKRLESLSAPIRRLPRDILLEIFSLCRPGHPGLNDEPRLDARDYPWTLGHICHWWRDIVHSSPMLWSVVVLHPPYNPKIVEMQLQRSGNVPLSVYIFIHHCGGGSVHSSAIIDSVMGLCHRWSKLELHAHAPLCHGVDPPPHADKLPSSLPQLQTLKVRGTWSSYVVPVLDAPLLKTVRLNEFPLQSVPNHITHLALSKLSIEELPLLSSFPNLVELHFTPMCFTQDAASTSMITHPTIRCLSVSGISMLPFLTLPALEHLQYMEISWDNSVISAFLSRSRCTLKTLLANMRYADESFLEVLGSQPSLCRLTVDPIGDYSHAVIRKLSSLDFLPNLEHLSVHYIDDAVKMIRARWYAPMRHIRTFVIISSRPKDAVMDSMEAMINEGLDVKVMDGPHRHLEVWLDPLMKETEDIL